MDIHTVTSIDQLTRSELAEFVRVLYACPFKTEKESSDWISKFIALVQHPSGSDLIYYPKPGKDDPDAVVAEVERYRHENGLPGFREELPG